jgi:hypothetical protein
MLASIVGAKGACRLDDGTHVGLCDVVRQGDAAIHAVEGDTFTGPDGLRANCDVARKATCEMVDGWRGGTRVVAGCRASHLLFSRDYEFRKRVVINSCLRSRL